MIEHDPLTLKLWAKTKPFHPLWCHLIDVGNTTRALLETPTFATSVKRLQDILNCSEEVMKNWLSYLTALHDIGKCHYNFQGKGTVEVVRPLVQHGLHCLIQDEGYRHEAMSAVWVQDLLTDDHTWPIQAARVAGDVMRGHHGDFGAPTPENPVIQQDRWDSLKHDLESIVRHAFKLEAWHPAEIDLSVFGLLLSGLLVWSDWIASNTDLFPLRVDQAEIDDYCARSTTMAACCVERLGLRVDSPWRQGTTFLETWRMLRIEEARPIQERCEELARSGIPPGLGIIEAPMGEGKTEAALYLATQWAAREDRNGIYVALPTAATSNQMYGRFKAFLADHNPALAAGARLLHGQAWLVGEDEAAPSTAPELAEGREDEAFQALDWFRPKKRSMLAPYGVGTIDQALFSVLHVRHGFLRLLGLSGKILVVDEVHAYDPYMSRILTRLLRWCRALRIPVLLLSATLPETKRRALIEAYAPEASPPGRAPDETAPYPLLTFVDDAGHIREEPVKESGRRQEIKLHHHHGLLGKPVEIARLALSLVERGGCLCVLVNTVDMAQQVYQAISNSLPEDDRCLVLLFHARFRAGKRREIEEEALKLFGKRSLLSEVDPEYIPRPAKAVLVATQVVEQSLDLDFDEMITEIAPIDLLLQRAGRLHRHGRPSRPSGRETRLHVIWPEPVKPPFLDKTEHVYQRFILLKTMAALISKNELILPRDIRVLVERVYNRQVSGEEADKISVIEDFLKSAEDALAEDSREADEAKQFLIPEPNQRSFRLALMRQGAFDEDEGGAASYFHAKTRLGERTMSVLVLEGDAWIKTLEMNKPPERGILADLMLRVVNLPVYWLQGVTAMEGFAEPARGPSWLPGQHILRLQAGVWRGWKGGEQVVIRDDVHLGLVKEKGG